MLVAVVAAARKTRGVPPFEAHLVVVNCHHN
jgi:hypothetical protein